MLVSIVTDKPLRIREYIITCLAFMFVARLMFAGLVSLQAFMRKLEYSATGTPKLFILVDLSNLTRQFVEFSV